MALDEKPKKSFINRTFGVQPVWTLAQFNLIPHSNAFESKLTLCFHIGLRLVVIIFYVSSFFASVYYDDLILSKNVPLILKIGNNLSMYLSVILMLSAWLMTRKFYQLDDIFELISLADHKITKLLGNESIIRRCHRIQIRFEAIFVIIFLICFALIGVYDILMYPPCPVFVVVIDYFPYAYPYVVASLITMQFISLVKMLELRFQTINECLNHLLLRCGTADNNLYKTNDESYFPELTTNARKLSRIFFISKTKQESIKKDAYDNINEKSLQMLFGMHDHLLDLSESVNRSFSTNTIIYVTVSFVYAMFGVFFETKELFYDFPNDLNLSMMATSYILWALQYIAIIFILLRVCEGARGSAYEAAMIVHKIVQKKPKFMEDDCFYNKMKSFTIHLLHRKKTFNFSGEGLFIFDYTFIFSVVSAGTSYLIVLLQFDMSFDRDEQ